MARVQLVFVLVFSAAQVLSGALSAFTSEIIAHIRGVNNCFESACPSSSALYVKMRRMRDTLKNNPHSCNNLDSYVERIGDKNVTVEPHRRPCVSIASGSYICRVPDDKCIRYLMVEWQVKEDTRPPHIYKYDGDFSRNVNRHPDVLNATSPYPLFAPTIGRSGSGAPSAVKISCLNGRNCLEDRLSFIAILASC